MEASQHIKRLEQLKTLRSKHEPVWRECFDHSYPLRGSGFDGASLSAQEGLNKAAKLLDSTSTDSVRVLASAIMSGLTPANARWFGLDAGNETEDEQKWLDQSAQTLWENIHLGTFDAAAFEGIVDCVCAGWFALFIDEDRDQGGLSFTQWPLASVYVATTKSNGAVDTVYREYSLSASQAVSEFGELKVPEKVRKAVAENRPDEMFRFVHAIYPRKISVAGAKLARNMPIASEQIEVESKHVCRTSGYHEMPVVVPRWMLIPDSVYGVGPVYDALPDIRELNDLKRLEKSAAELAVSGMWIAEDDGVLNPRTVKVGPKRVIIANSVDSMKPLLTGSDFNVAFTSEDKLRASIRKTLMADQLQPQDGPAMTATEVHVRVNLIRQLLGPIYGRLQAEYLQPLIARCFGLAFRAGVFGNPPESLAGREFSVKYLSPLARAQSLEDVTAMDRFEVSLMNQAQIMGPDILDNYDADKAAKRRAKLLGVPSDLLPTDTQIQAKREKRQADAEAAQQQQAAMAVQQRAGEAAVDKFAAAA
jgi:hypothetical protein